MELLPTTIGREVVVGAMLRLLLTEKADVTPAVVARAAAVKREERGSMVVISSAFSYSHMTPSTNK